MLQSTHGIGGTRNIVVYACPNTNRLVCENGGKCYTDTDHEDGYFINFRRGHASRRWYKWLHRCLSLAIVGTFLLSFFFYLGGDLNKRG